MVAYVFSAGRTQWWDVIFLLRLWTEAVWARLWMWDWWIQPLSSIEHGCRSSRWLGTDPVQHQEPDESGNQESKTHSRRPAEGVFDPCAIRPILKLIDSPAHNVFKAARNGSTTDQLVTAIRCCKNDDCETSEIVICQVEERLHIRMLGAWVLWPAENALLEPRNVDIAGVPFSIIYFPSLPILSDSLEELFIRRQFRQAILRMVTVCLQAIIDTDDRLSTTDC